MSFWRGFWADVTGGVTADVNESIKRGDHDRIDRQLPTSGIPGAGVDLLNRNAHAGKAPTGWDELTKTIPKKGGGFF